MWKWNFIHFVIQIIAHVCTISSQCCLFLLQSGQTLLATHPWMSCMPSKQPLTFSSLLLNDHVESAGCLHVTCCPTYIFSIINLRLAGKTDEYLPF